MTWNGFIVRPFGTRPVVLKSGQALAVDFDAIERLLIRPAMAQAGILGGTTMEMLAAGNIRADMFLGLARADVVVAEVSLHNANVFYELGARHALRPRRTFMLRFATKDPVPFDIATDRYLDYDPQRPEAAIHALAAGLAATLADADAVDSPIFRLLPALQAPPLAALMPVPVAFQEELRFAHGNKRPGHMVLLGREAQTLPWGAEGLRLVGRALVDLGSTVAATLAWEALRTRLGHDTEADLQLATLYQRQDKLPESDSAIARALDDPEASPGERAEALALRARNAKGRWQAAWCNAVPEARTPLALQSPQLARACADYASAFAVDLNHHYSGINALTLARLRLDLAERAPDAWADSFDGDEQARTTLAELKAAVAELMGAVSLSARAAAARLPEGDPGAPWVRCTEADVLLLRGERLGRVQAAYQRALEGAGQAVFDAQRRQWALLQQLGLFADAWPRLLPLLAQLAPASPDADATSPTSPERLVLFTGHRIDQPGRATPRFPASAEPAVRAALAAELQALMAAWPAGCRVRAVAGGASGGDILFHEVCHALGVPSLLYLPMPADQFVPRSVEVAGQPGWVPRFYAVHQRCEAAGRLRVLGPTGALPGWLAAPQDYNLWERSNRWMLHSALAHGAEKLTLLALWDGQAGDGPGGTQHMVNEVRAAGAAWRQVALPGALTGPEAAAGG